MAGSQLNFGNLVRNITEHIQSGNILFAQKINGMGFFFPKKGRQDTPPINFFSGGTLGVDGGCLQHHLNPHTVAGSNFCGNALHFCLEKFFQFFAQVLDVSPTVDQNVRGKGVIGKRIQQMFQGNKFVFAGLGFIVGTLKCFFEFLIYFPVDRGPDNWKNQ